MSLPSNNGKPQLSPEGGTLPHWKGIWDRAIGNTWIRPIALAVIAVSMFRYFGHSSSGPKENSPAPSFTLPLASDPSRTLSSSAFLGKPLVLDVMAHWCGACRSMAPRLSQLSRRYPPSSVTFLAVAVDGTAEEARVAHSSWGIPFDMVLGSSQFSRDYAISMLPTLIIIDKAGNVRHVTTGVTSASTLEGWLEELRVTSD